MSSLLNYLDFPHTCPDIDRAIQSITHDVYRAAEDLEDGDRWARSLMAEIKGEIESIRSQNSDLRSKAERQLGEWESAYNDACDDRDYYEKEVRRLEQEVEELKQTLSSLQTEEPIAGAGS